MPDLAIIHLVGRGGRVACCGRVVFELPRGDRITTDPDQSTCKPE